MVVTLTGTNSRVIFDVLSVFGQVGLAVVTDLRVTGSMSSFGFMVIP